MQSIGKSPLDETKTDLEDAQVAAVMTVNEMAKALTDGATADGDEPDLQTSDGQGQARQFYEVM